jgi:hypothetical protein
MSAIGEVGHAKELPYQILPGDPAAMTMPLENIVAEGVNDWSRADAPAEDRRHRAGDRRRFGRDEPTAFPSRPRPAGRARPGIVRGIIDDAMICAIQLSCSDPTFQKSLRIWSMTGCVANGGVN